MILSKSGNAAAISSAVGCLGCCYCDACGYGSEGGRASGGGSNFGKGASKFSFIDSSVTYMPF